MPRIFSFNAKSKGAKQLSRALGWPRIVHRKSEFRGNFKPWVLNWGSTEMEPHVRACKVINPPGAIAETTDKLRFFQLPHMQDLVPPFTTSREEAAGWIADRGELPEQKGGGAAVVCRKLLSGHGGAGIVIAETPEQLVPAPLYVLYVPKQDEYRVHVFDGRVIDVQQKRRRTDVPDELVDWRVRNHARGFVYARQELDVPASVHNAAATAMLNTDLDFGAVDVIYQAKKNMAYVLEINSAPGLEGQTLDIYVDAIRLHTGR